MDKEERKIQMDDDSVISTSLALEGIALFVDLREAQPCLWDPD